MKCVIVDDEKPALDLLESNIARVPFLQLAGKFTNPYEALSFLQSHPADILFIDVQMPGLTGTQMLSGLKSTLQVVMVTAYEQYAVAGFNLDVTDYLLKPVSFERFLKACLKCQQQHIARAGSATPGTDRNYFFVNVEYAQVKVNCNDVIYIEAMRDYVRIVLRRDKPIVTRLSLKMMETRLDGNNFLRIHKSYIVNTSTIISIRNGTVFAEGYELPLSENYREAVIRKLGISQ